MAWFDLGWLQVLWFVVVVYAVTAAAVHLCLRRVLRRRLAAEAEARGERRVLADERPLLVRIGRCAARALASARAVAARTRRAVAAGGTTVTVLPRPHGQVPQIAARPRGPAPQGGLSEGTPTMAITLLPRQRVIDLAGAERAGTAPRSERSELPDLAVEGGPVRWWHGTRG